MMNACAQFHLRQQEYYIGFMNKTGHDLSGVCVYFGSVEAAAKGGLVVGGCGIFGPVTVPIPAEAEMRWIDGDKSYAVKAKLEGVVPKGFSDDGTIYFVINKDDSVLVKAIKMRGDDDAFRELTKGLRPEGEYDLGFVNKTGRNLEAVSVYYSDQKAGEAGNILARVKVGYSGHLTLPIPSEAEVRWKESGVNHSVKTKLEGVVTNGYAKGTIFFVIKDDDTVEVKPIKWNDSQGSIKLVK